MDDADHQHVLASDVALSSMETDDIPQQQHAFPDNTLTGQHQHVSDRNSSMARSSMTRTVGTLRSHALLQTTPSEEASSQNEKAIHNRNLHDKERLLRLGLASLALTFMQARGETSPEHLSQLVARRLIAPHEFRILSRHMDKAPGQICWCWIAHKFTVAVRISLA